MDELARFKQTYFDESAELLGISEAGLLRLAPDAVDLDDVNAVFRAIHSIKGGAGAFGYDDLVAFAHEFETVMDGVRTETVPVTAALVDALIRANDALAQLVAYAREETPPPPGLTDAAVAALHRGLGDTGHQADRDEPPAASPPDDPPAPAAPRVEPAPTAAADPAADPYVAGYRIMFRPKPELLLAGNEPAFLFRALLRLGSARIGCDTLRVPPLAELEPELLYLGWEVSLETDADRAAVEDVFEFVADDSVLEIVPLTDAGWSDSGAPASTPAGALAPLDGTAADAAAAAPDGASAPPGTAGTALALAPTAGAAPPTGPDAPAEPSRRAAAAGEMPPPVTSHTIRVDVEKIERLVNMVGEMVITQAMITEHLREIPPGSFQELVEGLEQLSQHTRELRESVMAIRAQPVSSVFSRMPRLVRELAVETKKDVRLETSGEGTEVDKTVVENLVDPLTHMIRNSIDHGIEPPDERERVGKPRTGTVHLSAQHRSGRIVIEVADDGRGIDRDRVLTTAVARGIVPPGHHPGDDEIDSLIFVPGFSTAETVSSISGRGVGMDVVRRNITSLGGRITVASTPGIGARFVLSLPLTLAVLDGMVIAVGADRFVLPLTNIVESLRPKPSELHSLVNQCDVMMARGAYVRLVYLNRVFGIPNAVDDATKGLVVLIETEDGGRIGLVVDEVVGQQQVVIKSLEENFRRLDGVAAATILGDGRVALILDVAGIKMMSPQLRPADLHRLVDPSAGAFVDAAAPALPSGPTPSGPTT